MKRLVTTLLTLLTCGAVYALPVGNPSEASLFMNGAFCEGSSVDFCDPCFSWCDAWSLRVGFYGDYVFNRNMQVRLSDDDSGADVDTTTIDTNAGYIALNFFDRVDIFTTLGATNFGIQTGGQYFIGANHRVEMTFETAFSWSVGARATLWQCGCFALGVEGQYFQSNPDVNYIFDTVDGSYSYINDLDTQYQEWQVGVGVSYRFATSCPTIALVPYAGLKWAGGRWSFSPNSVTIDGAAGDTPDLQPAKLWGYAIGMTLTLCDVVGVTVEGRFADEKAVSVLGQFRF